MISIILVAAGQGKRMLSKIPKQFIEIKGQSILEYSLQAFSFIENSEIILVLHSDYFEQGEYLQKKYPSKTIKIVSGGEERFHSVRNAMEAISPTSEIVLIHDSVRPFVSKEMIERGIHCCQENGNGIPVITLNDSIREVLSNGQSSHKNRENYRLVQTPQAFKYSLLKEMYAAKYSPTFTDDASVLEAQNREIFLYEGDERNIKITRSSDLDLANYFLGA